MNSPTNQSDSLQSYLYIFNGLSIFLRRSFYAALHKHHAIQLVISLDKKFSLMCNEGCHEYSAVAIPPNQAHQILASEGWHATLHIEPESYLGRNLIHTMNLTLGAVAISGTQLALFKQILLDQIAKPSSYAHVKDQTMHFIESISQRVILAPMDDRVSAVQRIIQAKPNDENVKSLHFPDIALSKSRLAHLFVSQIGIPLSTYVLWVKIKVAIVSILNEHSLTDSAHIAGFSDLSHLSRTFKKMFGSTLSDLFQNNEVIQVFSEPLNSI